LTEIDATQMKYHNSKAEMGRDCYGGGTSVRVKVSCPAFIVRHAPRKLYLRFSACSQSSEMVREFVDAPTNAEDFDVSFLVNGKGAPVSCVGVSLPLDGNHVQFAVEGPGDLFWSWERLAEEYVYWKKGRAAALY
jgi:hypothetical protein